MIERKREGERKTDRMADGGKVGDLFDMCIDCASTEPTISHNTHKF